MRLGIDASNLREGGGITHLSQLLRAAEPEAHGVDRVIVWGGRRMLEELPGGLLWLRLAHEPTLDRSLPQRLWWQRFTLARRAASACDLLFVPGGNYLGTFRPFVTMFRNMLPFAKSELRQFGLSLVRLRLALLRVSQMTAFSKADGMIFLTTHAFETIRPLVPRLRERSVIIPHGIDIRFQCAPRPVRSLASCSAEAPFRLLYVSIIDVYKHQWHVAAAVGELRKQGIPVELTLAGPAYPPALERLQRVLRRIDPDGAFIQYVGPIPYEKLPSLYRQADGFVFASSCENMPNILLEAMASGLPIACSEREPMPELLGDAGVYFDPVKPEAIAKTLGQFLHDQVLRERLAHQAYTRSQAYSWTRCARETFSFLSRVGAGADAG